jgi:hypothetical protein
MMKVLLLIVLFNSQTGELQGAWHQGGLLPAFETMDDCQKVVREQVPTLLGELPNGMTLVAQCIEPGAEKASGPTT